jgi:hypothetical protein
MRNTGKLPDDAEKGLEVTFAQNFYIEKEQTKRTRAVVGAVVAMSLVANAVMAQQAGAGKPRQEFKGPVKVFILAGQSNMEGHAGVQTLDRLGEHPTHGYLLKKIKNDDGSFVVRDDVFVSYQKEDKKIKRPLSVGMGAWGADWFGPELMFGIGMGDYFREPVLLIKTCWGGHRWRSANLTQLCSDKLIHLSTAASGASSFQVVERSGGPQRGERGGRAGGLRLYPEHVVPIVLRRAEAFDGGTHSDHGASHIVTGGVGIEAAVNLATLVQQGPQPARVGPGAGGGKATVPGMEDKATDGIDGRFAKDNDRQRFGRNGEAAQVLLGAGRQAVPRPPGGAAQLGPDREVVLAPQQENGVGPRIGIEGARLDERLQ